MADAPTGPSGGGGQGGGGNGGGHRRPSVIASQSKRPKPSFIDDDDDFMALPASGSGSQNRNQSPSSSTSRWPSQESLGSTDSNFSSPVQSRSATPIGDSGRSTPGLSNLLRSADINSNYQGGDTGGQGSGQEEGSESEIDDAVDVGAELDAELQNVGSDLRALAGANTQSATATGDQRDLFGRDLPATASREELINANPDLDEVLLPHVSDDEEDDTAQVLEEFEPGIMEHELARLTKLEAVPGTVFSLSKYKFCLDHKRCISCFASFSHSKLQVVNTGQRNKHGATSWLVLRDNKLYRLDSNGGEQSSHVHIS